MAIEYKSLEAWGLAFFDDKKDTRGALNPLRIRKKDERDRDEVARIKRGKSTLLNICAITGKVGTYGKNIRAAEVKISKDGGFDRLRILVHDSVKQGMRHNERTILSVNRDCWAAKATVSRVGKIEKPFVRIYRTV